jgi:hypothetical protein
MPLFGKTGAKARDFFSSPAGQQVLAWGSQMVPGDPYGQFRANEARMGRQARQQQAIGDLMEQFQPDTMTPQVNELIGEANMAGRGRFDPMPMQQQQPGRFLFDTPEGRSALLNALGAGVSLDGISSLRDFMSPKRNTTKLGPDDILFDDEGNVVAQGPRKPQAPERPLVVPEGGTLFWPGEPGQPLAPAYKVPKTFAPPPPRAAPAPTTGQVPGPWNKYGVK